MSHELASTDELLGRAQGGDTLAVDALVRRHGPRLWALCSRMDRQAEDAYQEVWERLLRGLERFDPQGPASLATWMHTVARRVLIDRQRKRRVRGDVLPLPELHQAPRQLQAVEARQRSELLERALLTLPDPQRRVVVLHHIEGLELQAIAQLEAVALGTIKSRLHRGRARLVAALGASHA